MLDSSKSRFSLMLMLLIAAGILTYFFKNILGTGILFTHFFYVPIIMACVWWKKRGLIITVLLALFLMLAQYLHGTYSLTVNDTLRATMLFVVSIITVALSEQLTAARGALSASEEKYRTIFENTGTAMVIIAEDTTILLVNREFERLSGFRNALIKNKKSILDVVDISDRKRVESYHRRRRNHPEDTPTNYEFKLATRDGGRRDIFVTVDLIRGSTAAVASLLDITEMKQALASQRILKEQLAEALEKVLSGFIPICAHCKKIRDGNEKWVPIESFLKDRTQADFSHGICPDCVKLLYPDFIPKS